MADPVRMTKASFWGLLTDDSDFRIEVRSILSSIREDTTTDSSFESCMQREFDGAKVTSWNVTDNQGTVYGWPEEIFAKIIQTSSDLFVVPTSVNQKTVDIADLAVFLRIGQLYESMNRFTLRNQRPKVAFYCSNVTEAAKTVAFNIGMKILL